MNKGLLRGIPGGPVDTEHEGLWMPYGTNEGLPIVDAVTTTPTPTTQEAYYTVFKGSCFFYVKAEWKAGSGPGLGKYGFLAPPIIPMALLGDTRSGDSETGTRRILSVGYCPASGDIFGQKNCNAFGAAWINPFGMRRIPADRVLLLSPSPILHHAGPTVTPAQSANQSSLVVGHTFGAAPARVVPIPTTDTAAGNLINPPWISAKGVISWTMNFSPALNATGVGFEFMCQFSDGELQVTDKFPWTWQNYALVEIIGQYPVLGAS